MSQGRGENEIIFPSKNCVVTICPGKGTIHSLTAWSFQEAAISSQEQSNITETTERVHRVSHSGSGGRSNENTYISLFVCMSVCAHVLCVCMHVWYFLLAFTFGVLKLYLSNEIVEAWFPEIINIRQQPLADLVLGFAKGNLRAQTAVPGGQS